MEAAQETTVAEGKKTAAPKPKAATVGDPTGALVRASKSIFDTLVAIDTTTKDAKDARKKWNQDVAAAEARFRGAVTADDDGTDAGARAKLNEIAQRWQELEDAKTLKTDDLTMRGSKQRELKEKLKQQVEGVKQLHLFDQA